MSIHQNNIFSNTLHQYVHVNVILPEPMDDHKQVKTQFVRGNHRLPTLWLLHGLSGDAMSWLRNTNIEHYASELGLAVVMPETQRGFYTNIKDGPQYWDFLTKELVERMRFIFPLSDNPSENFLMGTSMGGYAVLKWGLSAPQKFNSIVAFSPVADLIDWRDHHHDLMPDFSFVFHDLNIEEAPLNINALLKQPDPADNQLKVFMSTGTTDFLRDMDLKFKIKFEQKLSDRFTWDEQSGGHNWTLWNSELPVAMNWLKQNM